MKMKNCSKCGDYEEIIDGLFNHEVTEWYCFKCCTSIISEYTEPSTNSLSIEDAIHRLRLYADGCNVLENTERAMGFIKSAQFLAKHCL